MVRTAIQLFTLRALDEPIDDVIGRVGKTTFDGIELYDEHFDLLADEATRDRARDALDDAGLDVAGAHVSVDRLDDSFAEVVEVCEAVGCPTLVVPSYDPDAFATREGIAGAADRIAGLSSDLDKHGLELCYHNHTFEFERIDGDVAFETFVDRAEDRFEFEPDVGLATHAGYDALDLLDLVEGRAPIVHLTDTVPGDEDALHADVGDGIVDIDACADAAAEGGAEWIVCENGRTTDALASLERGSEAFGALRARVDG